jgi:hypothetical protein
MHPALTQAVANERTREHYAGAAARQRTAEFRRSRRGRRPRPAVGARLVSRILRAA